MDHCLEHTVESLLIGGMADGFNRSIRVLKENKALDTTKLEEMYSGVGSTYYDLVTEQLELTARYAMPELLRLINEELQKNGRC